MIEDENTLPSASDYADTMLQTGAEEHGEEPNLSGTVLAERYRVLEQLGSGGMGTVYLAEHLALRRQFAVKVLSVEFWSRRRSVDRFLQEARTASKIEHANIVEITDFGYANETVPFFVMERLEGEDLGEVIAREGALPWPRVRALMLQILSALEAAHAAGVIHRDMKPQNVFCVRRGSEELVKVLDFGIAKIISDDADYATLTRTGTVLGTPYYMSPEQANSEELDVRADVYSAGVIAFELLTGCLPFQGRGFVGVLAKVLTEEVPSMASVAPDVVVHPKVEALVRRAMAKQRDDRYASAAEFAAAIRALPAELMASGRGSRPLWVALGLVGALGLAGAVMYVATDTAETPTPTAALASDMQAAPEVALETEGGAEPEATLETEGAAEPEATIETEELAALEPKPELADAGLADPETGSAAVVEPPPSRAARTKKRKHRPKQTEQTEQTEQTDPVELVEIPETLSNAAVNAALAPAKRGARECGKLHPSLFGSVKIELEVTPAGKVTSARALAPAGGTPEATCVENAVSKLTFPLSQRGFAKTVELRL